MGKEFKFRLDNSEVFCSIVNSEELSEYVNKDAVRTINMCAVYFDTEEGDLRDTGIAYRIRHENERITATIMWDINTEEDVHAREEFNLVINDERFAENPDIEVFKSSDAYEVLYRAAGDKKLVKTIEMKFYRKQVKINTGKSISALSLDQGTVRDLFGNLIPVCEMELEWYYGDEKDFRSIASYLSEKYNLVAENTSKLQRAFGDKICSLK